MGRPMRPRLAPPLTLALATPLGAAGIGGEPAPSGCASAEPRVNPIDAPVMAFLSAARALPHETARLAELRLGPGDLDGAAREAQAVLLRVEGPPYFGGHRLEVEGLAKEARAAFLDDAGRNDEGPRPWSCWRTPCGCSSQ